MTRGRRTLVVAVALAGFGAWLAYDAASEGSLFRYRLVAYAMAASLCVPLVTWLVLGGRRASALWRRVLFVCVPLGLCLLVGEGLTRAFGPSREAPAELREHARLGHVLVPGTSGTDANGFRNAAALDEADVLFVGDSQTYGFSVDREQAFAARFGARTGAVTYQMADGSYGPVQYRELVRRGLSLRPKVVVIGVYFGNDLVDALHYAALEGAADLRREGRRYPLRPMPAAGGGPAPNLAMAIVDGVLDASALLGLAARVVKSRLQGGVLDMQAGALPFEHPTAPTILLPEQRLSALDPRHEWVREGLRISRRALLSIASMCDEASAEVVVLTIPTKESAYAAWDGAPVPEVAPLRAAEQAARAALLAGEVGRRLRVVDAEPAIVAAMAAGRAPWFPTGDGHLNAVGHDVVAEALADAAIWSR